MSSESEDHAYRLVEAVVLREPFSVGVFVVRLAARNVHQIVGIQVVDLLLCTDDIEQ
jgi:hypothetical protein